MQRVTVVGLGYMGLPTALLIAKSGQYEVVGYDKSRPKLEALSRGQLPFDEPGLDELFQAARERFTVMAELEPSDIFLLALPTPIDAEHRCDLSFLHSACDALAPVVQDDNVIILESTVSPGTTQSMKEKLERDSGKRILASYVSEKATPGNTLHEMVHNDRIIGVLDDAAKDRTTRLYKSFVRGELCVTDAATAEATKLFENTYRDVNIALANELADVARARGIDVREVIALANRHPRVNILSPGPGVGGHCIPIDPWFLVQDIEPGQLIRLSRDINDQRPKDVAARVQQELGKAPGAKVAVLGTAYKADIDDDRESPAHAIIEALRTGGFEVLAHDPLVRSPSVSQDLEGVLEGARCVVLVTDHEVYKDVTFERCAVGHVVLDTRGLWQHRSLASAGSRYIRFGCD